METYSDQMEGIQPTVRPCGCAYACEMCEETLRLARGWFVLQGIGEPDWTLCSACLAEKFESKGTVPT